MGVRLIGPRTKTHMLSADDPFSGTQESLAAF